MVKGNIFRTVDQEMYQCEPGVTNMKVGQDHLSVSVLLGGGTPPFNGGLNQGKLIASSLVGVPVGLPRFNGCLGD